MIIALQNTIILNCHITKHIVYPINRYASISADFATHKYFRRNLRQLIRTNHSELIWIIIEKRLYLHSLLERGVAQPG